MNNNYIDSRDICSSSKIRDAFRNLGINYTIESFSTFLNKVFHHLIVAALPPVNVNNIFLVSSNKSIFCAQGTSVIIETTSFCPVSLR